MSVVVFVAHLYRIRFLGKLVYTFGVHEVEITSAIIRPVYRGGGEGGRGGGGEGGSPHPPPHTHTYTHREAA